MLFFRVLFVLLLTAYGCTPDYAIVAPEQVIYIEQEVEKEVPGEVWVESFTQPQTTNGVDIVWVIDRSCSMLDDEPQIMLGVQAMMDALPDKGWRLNMISTDPSKALEYKDFPLIPGDTLADAYDLFDSMANVPSAEEKGFEALHKYVTESPEAKYWMREDAALLVVFVSDEDDQSTRVFPMTSDFTDWYTSTRAEGSTFMSSVVHLSVAESMCNHAPVWEGKRYRGATGVYKGNVIDICTKDWSAGVKDAARKVEPHEDWELTYIPEPVSIKVFIDTYLNTDWHYDAATNKVVFDVIPPPASLVEIGYVIQPS